MITIKPTKEQYLIEVAECARHKAEEIEKRLKKGREMGADKSEHKFHKYYLELKAEWNKQWGYHDEYVKSVAKLREDLKIVNNEPSELVKKGIELFGDESKTI